MDDAGDGPWMFLYIHSVSSSPSDDYVHRKCSACLMLLPAPCKWERCVRTKGSLQYRIQDKKPNLFLFANGCSNFSQCPLLTLSPKMYAVLYNTYLVGRAGGGGAGGQYLKLSVWLYSYSKPNTSVCPPRETTYPLCHFCKFLSGKLKDAEMGCLLWVILSLVGCNCRLFG